MNISLANRLLQGGKRESKKVIKVFYKTCVLPKEQGSLDLLDISNLATNLSTNWVVRSFQSDDFHPQNKKCWKGFSDLQVFIASVKFVLKRFPLTCSMWNTQFKYSYMSSSEKAPELNLCIFLKTQYGLIFALLLLSLKIIVGLTS